MWMLGSYGTFPQVSSPSLFQANSPSLPSPGSLPQASGGRSQQDQPCKGRRVLGRHVLQISSLQALSKFPDKKGPGYLWAHMPSVFAETKEASHPAPDQEVRSGLDTDPGGRSGS